MEKDNLSICDRLDWWARYLLIHSMLYYELSDNLISDTEYDKVLKWLCKYSQEHLEDVNNCYYKELILNLDPCSGFYMNNYISKEHYKYLFKIAEYVLFEVKRRDRKKK